MTGSIMALQAEIRALHLHAEEDRDRNRERVENDRELFALMRDVMARLARIEERFPHTGAEPHSIDWKGLMAELGTAARNIAILIVAGVLGLMAMGVVDPGTIKSGIAVLREAKSLVPAAP